MKYTLVQKLDKKYIDCAVGVTNLITSERDALDLVAACGEYETSLLMIHAENLTSDFYNLKTGLAGKILLKFSNYSLKVAAVLTPELATQGRFGEMVLETNRRSQEFRVFYTRAEAEAWLL